MIYVDELRKYPHAKNRCFRSGACHMTADTLDELHEFAAQLGLKRAWFQNHSILPHYDLTASKRETALNSGAIFKSAREQVKEKRTSS